MAQIIKMLLMYRFQSLGLWGYCANILFSSIYMKRHVYEGAIQVPMAVICVCLYSSSLNDTMFDVWMFLVSCKMMNGGGAEWLNSCRLSVR